MSTRQWAALFMLLKLYRLAICRARCKKIMQWLRTHSSVVVLNLLWVVLFLLVFGHYVACLFFLVGVIERREYSWLWLEGGNGNALVLSHDCEAGEDIGACPALAELYLSCFYWALTTTLSSETQMDVNPASTVDKIYVLGVVVCGAFLGAVAAQEPSVSSGHSAVIDALFVQIVQSLSGKDQCLNFSRASRMIVWQRRLYTRRAPFITLNFPTLRI